MSDFVVKFVPWNENTISALINKTIKFSNIYEFNDFSEYRYLGYQGNICSNTKEILEKELSNKCFLNNLEILASDNCNKEYKNKIIDALKKGTVRKLLDKEEHCLSLLLENLAYSSVGIFCFSNIDVFTDDSAQLMFAHYGGGLKGLALIYELENSEKQSNIQYDNGIKSSVGAPERHLEWYDGNYTDSNMNDFLYKSCGWKYEQENRIFAKPGIVKAKQHNLTLKAILYTSRFAGEYDTLKIINDKIYHDSLMIKKVSNHCSEHHFNINGKNSIDFLRENLLKIPPIHKTIIRKAELKDKEAICKLAKKNRLADLEEKNKYNPEPIDYSHLIRASDKAVEGCFQDMLQDNNYLIFIAEAESNETLGFIIGKLIPTAKTHTSYYLSLVIDDFCVRSPDLWQSVGKKLLDDMKSKAKEIKQVLIACRAHDNAKRQFLNTYNCDIASAWFIKDI